jgi:NAD(P)-dependent dehydrogenase (short-subunit alcohol dehydrogenase family)
MYNRVQFTLFGIASFIFYLIESFFRLLLGRFCGKDEGFKKENVRNNLVGSLAIVTGSNTGIGKATATALAMQGAIVVLACRDEKRGINTANEINLKLKQISLSSTDSLQYPYALKGKARFMKLDLSDLHSVLDFSLCYKEEFDRLDILVNNAGLNIDSLLSNGVEQLFQINYLGHYLLYRCFEDMLRKPSLSLNDENNEGMTGRVISLSSAMHHCGQGNYKVSAFRKYSWYMRCAGFSYYDDSKLYINFLTMEINKRNDQFFSKQQQQQPDKARQKNVNNTPISREVIAISVNPGAVSSDIWRHVPFKSFFLKLISCFFLSTNEGSKSSVYAALIKDSLLKSYREATDRVSSERGGRLLFYRDIPYFSPYHMYWNSFMFELLGYCQATPELVGVSLPQCSSSIHENSIHDKNFQVSFSSPEDLSKQLWDYSGVLCKKLLIQSGLSENDVAFLK